MFPHYWGLGGTLNHAVNRFCRRQQGMELGQGFIDYKPILRAAKKAGVLYAFAEQEAPYRRSQLESAQVSYDYLRSVERVKA